MEEYIKGALNGLPRKRPSRMIDGVISEHAATQGTVDELNASGFSDDSVFVLAGDRGAEALRHRGEGRSLVSRLWGRFVEYAGAGDDFVRRHTEAAERGKYVIGVRLVDATAAARDRVRDTLASHGARDIVSVGNGFTEEMPRIAPRLTNR